VRSRATASALGLGVTLVLALSAMARGASSNWIVTADRSTVPMGAPTQVTLTVPGPPLDQAGELMNCIVIQIPAVYQVGSTGYTDSRGYSWSVTYATGKVNAKVANNNQGLASPLDHLTLRVTVTGKSPGRANWNATAYDKNDCKHNSTSAPPIPMSVVGSTPTPTPTPRPTPTLRPTPTPTPRPTPTLRPTPTPTPRPTPTLRPTPRPTVGSVPSASSAPTSAPSSGPPSPPSTSPAPTPAQSETAPPLAGTGGASGSGPPADALGPLASPALRLAPLGDTTDLTFGSMAFSTGFGAFAWTVPGFLLGLPGILLLLIFAAQTTSVALFVPITRRVLGTGRNRLAGRVPRGSTRSDRPS
jgi:hypothetical protein